MHHEIQSQKILLQAALNWIAMGENCDLAIKTHPDKLWWMEKKKECAKGYAECMATLLIKFVDIEEITNELTA